MTEPEAEPRSSRDLGTHLDRIWRELKDLTRQVESETRRGGQLAKLHYDIRGLRQERADVATKLGEAVFATHRASARRPALARVPGYDELVAQLDTIEGQIAAKQQAIAALGGDVTRGANAA
jgi:hypothetical protein